MTAPEYGTAEYTRAHDAGELPDGAPSPHEDQGRVGFRKANDKVAKLVAGDDDEPDEVPAGITPPADAPHPPPPVTPADHASPAAPSSTAARTTTPAAKSSTARASSAARRK